MLVGIGAGFVLLAFLALRTLLREQGEERWSAFGVPFVVIGCTLFAMLPAMEFSVVAAAETGADAQSVQAALDTWFVRALITGALHFGIGALAFAAGIARSRLLERRLALLVVGALIVMAIARFVPLGTVQFYVGGLAGRRHSGRLPRRRHTTDPAHVTRS